MSQTAKKGFRYESIKFAQLMDGVCFLKHSIFKLEFYVTRPSCEEYEKHKSTLNAIYDFVE